MDAWNTVVSFFGARAQPGTVYVRSLRWNLKIKHRSASSPSKKTTHPTNPTITKTHHSQHHHGGFQTQKKTAPVRVESLIVMLTKPHRIDGKDFRSQKGRENSRFRGSVWTTWRTFSFLWWNPYLCCQSGGGEYFCFLGGNKRDGGMILNFRMRNIMIVFF